MRFKRLIAIIRKETLHILRDRTSFLLTLLSPVFLLITMAYAFSVEVREVAVAVLDMDNAPLSRQYIQGLEATGDVVVRYRAYDFVQVKRWLVEGRAKAAVVIPSRFDARLRSGQTAPLQVLVDGTDPATANAAMAHIGGYTGDFARKVVASAMGRLGAPIPQALPVELNLRVLYNPRLKLLIGFLPALIALVLSMPAVAATSSLVREKEYGTFEQLIVTPLSRAELMVGKLIPYLASGLLSVVLCVMVAVALFNMPMRGSLPLYILLSADFFLAAMGIALVISALTKSQQVAQVGAILVFFFPGFFLSGFFYPIFSMPDYMQMEAMGLPTTHYVFISRGLFLKGQGMESLWPYAVALFGMGIAYIALAAVLFKKKL